MRRSNDIMDAGGYRRMNMPAPDRRMGGWTASATTTSAGRTFPPQPLPASAEDVARFYRSIGEVRSAPEIGTRIPAFLLNEIRALKQQMKFPPGVLHAQEEIEMHSAARLGELLMVSITVTNKYIRNDKRFIVFDQHVRCATDQLHHDDQTCSVLAMLNRHDLKPGRHLTASGAAAHAPGLHRLRRPARHRCACS